MPLRIWPIWSNTGVLRKTLGWWGWGQIWFSEVNFTSHCRDDDMATITVETSLEVTASAIVVWITTMINHRVGKKYCRTCLFEFDSILVFDCISTVHWWGHKYWIENWVSVLDNSCAIMLNFLLWLLLLSCYCFRNHNYTPLDLHRLYLDYSTWHHFPFLLATPPNA